MTTRLSLAELVSIGIRLRPAEAVAIVADICRQQVEGAFPGVPSAGVLRLTSTGAITVEGPVSASGDDVKRAAKLLESLLPEFDAPPEFRASGALRLVIARALGTLDLPRFASLADFRTALARFTTLDAQRTVADLVRAWEEATRVEETRLPAAAIGAPAALHQPPRSSWVGAQLSGAALLVLASFVVGWYLAADALPEQAATIAQPVRTSEPAPRTASVRAEASAPAPARVPPPATAPAPAPQPDRAESSDSASTGPRMIRAAAYSPAFAGSGDRLYFHEQRDGVSTLKVAQTSDGGRVTSEASVVDDRALNFHAKPSPDGSLIAFDSDRDGTRAVFVAAVDGGAVRRISGTGYAAVPTWSPDGTRLTFVRAEAHAPRVWNLWMCDADGAHLRRLTNHRVGQAWAASWFPDGRRIAYSVETKLILLDLLTGKTQTFDSPRPGRLVRTPAVSPEGRRIVFQVHRDGAWLLDVSSGRMERVLNDPTAEEFTWTPDGRRVAFHSRRSGVWSVWGMAI